MNRMNEELRRDSRKDPAQLEREIDATRAELRSTLEELEHRLSPSDIFDTVMSRVRRDGGQFAGNLGNSVKENPVPALLTSIGIAWLMAANGRHHNGHASTSASSLRGSSHRMRDSANRMRESASHMRESAGRIRERWHSAKESMRHRGDSARQGMHGGMEGTRRAVAGTGQSVQRRMRSGVGVARRGAGQARSGLDYLWHEQPLILGAIGFAAGAIAGAALPPTEQEDRALGEMRDRALARAKAAGAEGARQARERVESAAETTRSKIEQAGSGDGRSDAYRDDVERRNPDRARDQRLEPDAPQAPSPSSSPGTGLGY